MNLSNNSQQLSVRNLEKIFSRNNSSFEILADISFSIKKHEFVSIIGPSGCGKTTLFNIISGIDEQTTGEILLDKKNVKDRKGKFGYMLQDASLLPWKTVIENVRLGEIIKGRSKKYAKEKALELLQEFGLVEFINHYPSTLSGGMQQRVALLRTVLFHPELLLLDEPFGSLDALTRREAQIWLLSVWEKLNSTILFITHDIQEAILLSDTIYVMSHRPAKLLSKIKVSLPRPRRITDLTTNNAKNLEKELVSLLRK